MENQDIGLNDLALVVNIIDACSQRGAFKGEELASVGMIRQKFANIIKLNTDSVQTVETSSEEEKSSE